jgi:hypothetical protein
LSRCRNLSELFGHYLINIGFAISHQPFLHHRFRDENGAVLQMLSQMAEEYRTGLTGHLQVIRALLIGTLVHTMRKVERLQRFNQVFKMLLDTTPMNYRKRAGAGR